MDKDSSCKELCRYYGTDECPYKKSPWHCEKFRFREDKEQWLWWDKEVDKKWLSHKKK